MAQQGKNLVTGICIYLIAKSILNLVLGGFAMGNFVSLLIQAGLAGMLFFGVRYGNYIAGAVLALVAVRYLPGNLGGLPGSLLYLLEGGLDLFAAALLFFSQDIKAYFPISTMLNGLSQTIAEHHNHITATAVFSLFADYHPYGVFRDNLLVGIVHNVHIIPGIRLNYNSVSRGIVFLIFLIIVAEHIIH